MPADRERTLLNESEDGQRSANAKITENTGNNFCKNWTVKHSKETENEQAEWKDTPENWKFGRSGRASESQTSSERTPAVHPVILRLLISVRFPIHSSRYGPSEFLKVELN